MKARVKATGKIIDVKSIVVSSVTGGYILKYVDQKTGISYFEMELFFPKDLTDEPDYWTRLEHQYAGVAMQGLLSNHSFFDNVDKATSGKPQDLTARIAESFAHSLVEKLKESK